jgi:cytochrome c biogenesis protein ResB
MKRLCYLLIFSLLAISCGTSSKIMQKKSLDNEPVTIKNDSLQYEITIIDNGFNTYLHSIAKPINYYSKAYYETKNQFYVTEWNIRVQNPLRYDDTIYENKIDYDLNVDYGLEVNYKLYNYFKFVEYKYKQRFF